jgi:hypothetical protein
MFGFASRLELRAYARRSQAFEDFTEAINGTRNFALAPGRANSSHHLAVVVLWPLKPDDQHIASGSGVADREA